MKKRFLKRSKILLYMKGFIPALLIIGMMLLYVGFIFIPQPVQAGETRTYFKFDIPKMEDGSRVKYSPGWFGRMTGCPKNTTVVYYNDVEGYGIAYTVDTKPLPYNVTMISQSLSESTTSTAKDEPGIYFGTKLQDRWLPEILIEEKDAVVKDGVASLYTKTGSLEPVEVVKQKAVLCPVCGTFLGWYYDGLTSSRTILLCPNGHKISTISSMELDAKYLNLKTEVVGE